MLTSEELEGIRGEFTSRGSDLPDPAGSFVMGAFSSGRLVGFAAVQAQIHMEPFRCWDPHAFCGLERATEREILARVGPVSVFLVAESRVASLAELFEFKPVSAFKKELL